MVWDPSPEIFTIGSWGIRWYGLFFALGFYGGYRWLGRLIGRPVADRLVSWLLVGMLVGSRLVHVVFYDWPYYSTHLWEIVKLWEGGLASHGGVVGAMVAMVLFGRVRKQPFLLLLDFVGMAAMIPAGAIRIGNFFNQEVLGTVSNLPWAVAFGHPIDGLAGVPRHPVQLYEALFYWGLGLALLACWRRLRAWAGTGAIAGLVLLVVFSFRLLIEGLKVEQSHWISADSGLGMGQLLSIPILALGAFLLLRGIQLVRQLRRREGQRAG
jgi:prolipoprotein diacylglyceryl transferase